MVELRLMRLDLRPRPEEEEDAMVVGGGGRPLLATAANPGEDEDEDALKRLLLLQLLITGDGGSCDNDFFRHVLNVVFAEAETEEEGSSSMTFSLNSSATLPDILTSLYDRHRRRKELFRKLQLRILSRSCFFVYSLSSTHDTNNFSRSRKLKGFFRSFLSSAFCVRRQTDFRSFRLSVELSSNVEKRYGQSAHD